MIYYLTSKEIELADFHLNTYPAKPHASKGATFRYFPTSFRHQDGGISENWYNKPSLFPKLLKELF
jgi:hypothetical protein